VPKEAVRADTSVTVLEQEQVKWSIRLKRQGSSLLTDIQATTVHRARARGEVTPVGKSTSPREETESGFTVP